MCTSRLWRAMLLTVVAAPTTMGFPASSGSMIAHPLRLRPGAELKQSLLDFCAAHDLRAAFVATCVGSVSAARLRMASCARDDADPSQALRDYGGNREIVSLVGTLSPDGAHLHVTIPSRPRSTAQTARRASRARRDCIGPLHERC